MQTLCAGCSEVELKKFHPAADLLPGGVGLYVDHILHRDQFWVISIASGSVRLWDLRSCCMVLSHVMRGASSWSPPVLWRES